MALSRTELMRLSALLDEAWELSPADRAAWLDGLPDSDAVLLPQLREALADDAAEEAGRTSSADPGGARGAGMGAGRSGSRASTGPATLGGLGELLSALPRIASEAVDARLAQTPDAGLRVGPYHLVRPVGHGGMGTVWLAERVEGTLRRSVALKLPHASAMQRPELARRFDRERDILASLEHPHIARLYDAGVSAEGQPYLAMEYVEGEPITRWCDERRLGLRPRIDLFLQVLDAVQYAHARLVVHRDLKPSNILVGQDGQVRLLDFGIATLLEDTGEGLATGGHTEWAHAPMTPDYASPEQIARKPIGTASDVYSLGVLFFELVTGQRPYKLARDSRGALEDAILGVEPTRPTRVTTTESSAAQRALAPAGLRRQLKGDLDNIALMALRKNPSERYASAEAFKQDLKRWLRNKPVHAHPGSWGYRARKFVQRHKLSVGAIALAGTGMVAGLAVALDQAAAARRESQRTRAVQDFLVGLFNAADPARAQGRELTARDLLAQGERDLQERLGAEPDLQAALGGVLIDIYGKLGDAPRALPLATARLELMRRTHGEASVEHARALVTLAFVQRALGRHDASLASLDQAQALLKPHPEVTDEEWSRARLLRADNFLELARFPEARAVLQRELPTLVRLHGAQSYEVAVTQARIATSLATEGLHDQATAVLRELEPLLLKDWRREGTGAAALRADLGFVQWKMRHFAEAAVLLERAIAELDQLATRANTQSIQATRTLGMVYLDAGRFQRADEALADNVSRSKAQYGETDGETGLNLSFQVMGLVRANRLAEAEATAVESVRIAQARAGSLSVSEVRGFKRRLAWAMAVNGHAAQALPVIDEILAQEAEAGQTDARHAASLLLRSGALNALGRGQDAVAAAQAAEAAWAASAKPLGAAGQIGMARAQLNQALAWLTLQQPERAAPLLDTADALLRQAHGTADHPDLHVAALVRARWMQAQGRQSQAAALEERARARYQALSGVAAPQRLVLVF